MSTSGMSRLEWSWGAAANDGIYWNDIGDSTAAGIGNAEFSAICTTVTHGNDQFGCRHGLIGTFKCSLHVSRDRAGDQKQICMTR